MAAHAASLVLVAAAAGAGFAEIMKQAASKVRPPRWRENSGCDSLSLLVCAVCLAQALIPPMRDCVWAAPRGPCAIRRVGGLCPGGVRCGVSF